MSEGAQCTMMRKPCVPLAEGFLGGSQTTSLYNDIYNKKVVNHLVQCPDKNLKSVSSHYTSCPERQNNLKCSLMADA
jgi:hypothetical protein